MNEQTISMKDISREELVFDNTSNESIDQARGLAICMGFMKSVLVVILTMNYIDIQLQNYRFFLDYEKPIIIVCGIVMLITLSWFITRTIMRSFNIPFINESKHALDSHIAALSDNEQWFLIQKEGPYTYGDLYRAKMSVVKTVLHLKKSTQHKNIADTQNKTI